MSPTFMTVPLQQRLWEQAIRPQYGLCQANLDGDVTIQ